MKSLSQKVIVITGGASGIGATAVRKVLEQGACVAIWDFNKTKGEQSASELRRADFPTIFVETDVTNEASVANAVRETVQSFGRIDGLVNNAGITADATLLKMTESDFDKVIAVNLKGPFLTTKAVALQMQLQGAGGSIVNTSSVVAHYGNFGQTNYVASKAGLIGMTKVWARELGKQNIRVNAVAPGFIETEMIATVPQKVVLNLQEKTPLKRLGSPEEIANAYLFLLSDASSFVTGTVLSADGGLTL